MTDKEKLLAQQIKLALFGFFGHNNYNFQLGALDKSKDIPKDKLQIAFLSNMNEKQCVAYLEVVLHGFKEGKANTRSESDVL